MNREIKFKAWVPAFKLTLDVFALYSDGDIGMHPDALEEAISNRFEIDWDNSCVVTKDDNQSHILNIMQGDEWIVIDKKYFEILLYTGLKDKNGKEIYEGDIIRWAFPPPHDNDEFYEEEVKWDECGFFLDGGAPLTVADGDCLVIGNIYENPELLKS